MGSSSQGVPRTVWSESAYWELKAGTQSTVKTYTALVIESMNIFYKINFEGACSESFSLSYIKTLTVLFTHIPLHYECKHALYCHMELQLSVFRITAYKNQLGPWANKPFWMSHVWKPIYTKKKEKNAWKIRHDKSINSHGKSWPAWIKLWHNSEFWFTIKTWTSYLILILN